MILAFIGLYGYCTVYTIATVSVVWVYVRVEVVFSTKVAPPKRNPSITLFAESSYFCQKTRFLNNFSADYSFLNSRCGANSLRRCEADSWPSKSRKRPKAQVNAKTGLDLNFAFWPKIVFRRAFRSATSCKWSETLFPSTFGHGELISGVGLSIPALTIERKNFLWV